MGSSLFCDALAFGGKAAAVVRTGWTGAVAFALAVYATITTEAGWGILSMGAATAGSLIAVCLVLLGRVPTAWIIRGPFAFRPASSRLTATAHVASTLGQIVLFWGFFLGLIPFVLSGPGTALGGSAPASDVCRSCRRRSSRTRQCSWRLVSGSDVDAGRWHPVAIGDANRLVIAGPYRCIRNPMAVAGIVQGAAIGLILQSWLVIAYAVVGSLVWNYAVRPLEESDLLGTIWR